MVAQAVGEIQISKENTGTDVITPLLTNDSSRLGYVAPASRTNPQEHDTHLKFLEGGFAIDEKEIIHISFKPGAAVVVESEESKAFFEVTIVDKLTGKERTSALTFDNMTGFTFTGAVDITCRANERNAIASFEVPSNQQYILGKKDGQGRVYVYLGDNS